MDEGKAPARDECPLATDNNGQAKDAELYDPSTSNRKRILMILRLLRSRTKERVRIRE